MTRISIALILPLLWAMAGTGEAMPPNFSMLDLAEKSDIAMVGTVETVGNDAAGIKITRLLSGRWDSDTATVAPVRVQHCLGESVHLKAGERVLIFGKKTNGNRVTIVADGYGKISLDNPGAEAVIVAAERLAAVARLKDERQKSEAMFAEVKSRNEVLRSESCRYIGGIGRSEHRKEYKKRLAALLDDPDPQIQRAALQGIQFIQAEEVVPRIAELARSKDCSVVEMASMALGQYDTPESVAALVALTKHEDPGLRTRAAVDLRPSKRPEAKQAIERLLVDKDPRVRAIAADSFVYWFRRGEGDDVLPRLVKMLDDPSAEVCAAAARGLGESRNSDVVPPLMAVLKHKKLDENVQLWTLRSLYCHASKDNAPVQSQIDNDINVIIAALKSGPKDEYGTFSPAVGILELSDRAEAREALRWAAESHPNRETRAYAKRCLSQ